MKWKRSSQDRLDRLARSIEAIGERDQRTVDEAAVVDRLRIEGAVGLYAICRKFVDDVNSRLTQPALLLEPPSFPGESFDDCRPNLLQISLRGRLLQLEYAATDEMYSTEDYRRRYVLRGGVRSFNQNFLELDTVDEQQIFFCPSETGARWYFFDPRTYRSGLVTVDYLAAELERLL